ncbi:MAG: TadE/TadG family type IV pilus assembly protein, partial [Pseudomonadota bacterium]
MLRNMRRWRKDEDGSTTVEFVLALPLFFTLLMAIFELSYLVLKIVTFDDAVAQASRFIYTGAAQGGAITAPQLEGFICENAPFFTDCEENIMVEARPIADFGATPTDNASCRDSADTGLQPAAAFSAGGSNEIMFLRVCVTTDTVFPLDSFGLDIDRTPSGRIQLVSQTAFTNEP